MIWPFFSSKIEKLQDQIDILRVEKKMAEKERDFYQDQFYSLLKQRKSELKKVRPRPNSSASDTIAASRINYNEDNSNALASYMSVAAITDSFSGHNLCDHSSYDSSSSDSCSSTD